MIIEKDMHVVANEAASLVRTLPSSLLDTLIRSLRYMDCCDWATARSRIVESFGNPHYRGVLAAFLDVWQERAPQASGEAIALALLAAGINERKHRENQSIELVWTGPDVGGIPLRQTEQAILQVINSASRQLTIVSYAIHNIPHIREALIRAAKRGVAIKVIAETPDKLETEKAYSTLKALGPEIADRCCVYLWPLDKRRRDDNGRHGLLHVKCVVADGRSLLLTSANLTDYAFTLNMELGLLITGGDIPARVEGCFDHLIQAGILSGI
jgi:phosphatidylserine/phosphatidylglycerophosphate/cardiolipin synthase-like enzyme